MALAAALVFGGGGAGAVYFLTKDDNKGGSSASGGNKTGGQSTGKAGSSSAPSNGSSSGGGSGGSSASGKPSEKADPTPVDYKNINLTAGYHLTLGDEVVRPQEGQDSNYELSYSTGGHLDAEATGGKLVLLDPGQEGTLDVCRAETRFTNKVYDSQLSPGRQMCVITGTGHMGLVTLKAFSPDDSPSTYVTLDLTVWRNGAV
ncbi:hypothetical protein KV205_35335 [Streptomyces sp. SKN60]|uniref:hypothetical protein n=1 Tax=Streptomyces sp. SKN60 TaxID=2855506 RepID=UPI002247C27E|nr:hypothetical protein [Streptomyces sp. SKN60]MCX2185738.1 hypothetical protein [Streptomyces sp. SKN60]